MGLRVPGCRERGSKSATTRLDAMYLEICDRIHWDYGEGAGCIRVEVRPHTELIRRPRGSGLRTRAFYVVSAHVGKPWQHPDADVPSMGFVDLDEIVQLSFAAGRKWVERGVDPAFMAFERDAGFAAEVRRCAPTLAALYESMILARESGAPKTSAAAAAAAVRL